MTFLLRLGFLRPGVAYPLAELTPAEQAAAADMELLGLLYVLREGPQAWRVFAPRRHAAVPCHRPPRDAAFVRRMRAARMGHRRHLLGLSGIFEGQLF